MLAEAGGEPGQHPIERAAAAQAAQEEEEADRPEERRDNVVDRRAAVVDVRRADGQDGGPGEGGGAAPGPRTRP